MMITRRQFTIVAGAGMLAGGLGGFGSADAAEGWAGLGRTFADLEAKIGGRLGVAVHDLANGRRTGHRMGERFPMCSTSKVLSCSAVLSRVDAGHEDLHRRIQVTGADLLKWAPVTRRHVGGEMTLGALCEAALAWSDNTAENLILASLGGPASVTAFVRSIGDTVTRFDRTEPSLNTAIPGDPRDTTTPEAMAGNLRALVLGDRLSQSSRTQLTAWLDGCRTGDAKLRAGVPKDWRVGDKTGNGGYGSNNDIAVLWPPKRSPLIITVYQTQTRASQAARDAVIAAVGRAAARALTA